MNRRQAISRMAILLGGTLSAPTLSAMERMGTPSVNSADFSLTETQRKILAEVAEHIIPKTNTPGAKDAGVPAFIEMMLKDCYKAPEHNSFITGLVNLEKKNFLNQNKTEQIATLKEVEKENKELMKAYSVKQIKVGDNVDKESMEGKVGVPFWRLVKELTLFGYFTSEQGVTTNFTYEPIPGKFEPIKVQKGQKVTYH
ncbi:MAG: gluconate 2-dehydrogenase subunit 3 family protein [Saprospiraceae bacterium]|nr:gluconate 2-dehydrogenase subunit 3 family protein [Saprospiraceae bacterium]